MHKKLILLIFACLLSVGTSLVFAQDTIAVGDTVNGDETQAEWQLFLEAGQLVQIDLTSDAFDPFLDLSTEDGELLQENDDIDFPKNTNSQIIFTAGQTGNYILGVKSFGSETPGGAYTLTVTELEIKDRLSKGELAFDEPTIVSPDGAKIIEFTFQGDGGEVVNISAVSQLDEDTNLTLYDANDNVIAMADDNRAGQNPFIIRFKLPESAEYRIEIAGFQGQALFSPIEVSLEKSEELLLNDGSQTVSLGNTRTQDMMVLNTKALQRYIVTITLSKETASTLFVDIQEGDEEFASKRISGSGIEELSFIFAADLAGQARFVLSFFSLDETDLDFTVSVETVSK